MIDNYDAPELLTELAPAVTAIVCTCDLDTEVDLSSLALGLEDGMLVSLNDPVVAAAIMAATLVDSTPVDLAAIQGLAERLGCEPSPSAVRHVASSALDHVVLLRSAARSLMVPSTTESEEPVQEGPDKTSLEWLLAEMDAAGNRVRAVNSAN